MQSIANSQFSIRINYDLKQSLEKLSKISHSSKSQIANKAIYEYIDKNEWKIDTLQKAKKEADKGIFISQESIVNWLDSWGSENELKEPEADVFHNN